MYDYEEDELNLEELIEACWANLSQKSKGIRTKRMVDNRKELALAAIDKNEEERKSLDEYLKNIDLMHKRLKQEEYEEFMQESHSEPRRVREHRERHKILDIELSSKEFIAEEEYRKTQKWSALLDSNNTIDQHELHQVSRAISRAYQELPQEAFRSIMGLGRPSGFEDTATKIAKKSLDQKRYTDYLSRLDYEIYEAHRKGWFIVFDTLTIEDDKREELFSNKYAIRDHARNIGREINETLGRNRNDSYTDVFSYFGVPEYGKREGRLHWHFLYLMKELPKNAVDPNLGRMVRNRRIIDCMRYWKYGFSSPIAVRYSGDAFSRRGWLWPVDRKGKPLEAKPLIAICKYMTKYINKERKEKERWKTSNKTNRQFRIRMSRNFGMTVDLSKLSLNALWEMSYLHYTVTKRSELLRMNAKRQLSSILAEKDFRKLLELKPKQRNMLEQLRGLILEKPRYNPQNSIDMKMPRLRKTDLSKEVLDYIGKIDETMCRVALSSK